MLLDNGRLVYNNVIEKSLNSDFYISLHGQDAYVVSISLVGTLNQYIYHESLTTEIE